MKKIFRCMLAGLLAFTMSAAQMGAAVLAQDTAVATTTTASTETTAAATTAATASETKESKNKPITLPYYYYQLSDTEKVAYKKMITALRSHQKEVKLGMRLSDEQFEKLSWISIVYDASVFDMKDMSGSTTKSETTLYFKYEYTKESYIKMKAKLDKRADEIIGKFTDKMTTYQKVKVIHDEIINNCEYVLEGNEFDSAYGALIYKKAKCTGYAQAFAYVCNRAGIRTTNTIGGNGTHIWNMVLINNKWYHIDLTWDDPVCDYPDNTTYNFFLLSKKQLLESQVIDACDYKIPEATDESLSYYVKNKLIATGPKSAEQILISLMADGIKNGKTMVSIKCSSADAYQKIVNSLINEQKLFDVYTEADKQAGKSFCKDLIYYNFEDKTHIMTFSLYYPNTSLSKYYNKGTVIDSETLKKLSSYGIK